MPNDPDVFFATPFDGEGEYDQYRLAGDTVVWEHVCPRTFASGAALVQQRQLWSLTDFSAANGLATAQSKLREFLEARAPERPKRPADVIGNAVHVMKVLTGEADDDATVDDGKDPAAKALGAKGGAARAKAMSPERRSEIAKAAAAKRWGR